MAQLKPRGKQESLVVNVFDANPDVNGFYYPTSPAVRSPAGIGNPKLENRLKEAWQRAEKEFQQTTGKALGSYDIKSKDGILKSFKQKYDADDSDSKKSSALQLGTLENVLNAVTVVGAFAAQGVGMIFGPADMCFNAVAFLLSVPAQIKKVYDELQALFQEIERFLTKFKIYKRIEDGAGLGDELYENTNNLLTCFVKVFGTASKVLQGSWRDRMKNNLRVVLLSDDRVGGALEEFKKLCSASDSLVNTVMLEHVISSEANIKTVLSSTRRIEGGVGVLVARSNDEKTSLVNRDRLNLVGKRLFANPPNEDILLSANQDNNEETLEILQSVEEYRQWVDDISSPRSTLVIWGAPGSGKSYMLESIREHLNNRRENALRGQPSIYVAKHSFDETRSKPVDDQSKNAYNKSAAKADAVRRIAYQVAMQSTNYTKELATLLSENSSVKSEKDFTKVFNSLKLSQITAPFGATMYVLLDGVEENDIVGDLRVLLNLLMAAPTQEGLQIKVLLVMNTNPSALQTGQFLAFSLDTVNQKLLASFAVDEMQRRDFLQEDDKQTREFREAILEKLTTNASDITFKSIRQKLIQLQEAIDEDRPQTVMSNILEADNDSGQLTEEGLEILADLETTLTERGITLLNKIIGLLLYSPNGMRELDELEAFLYLDKAELPIEPLRKKISRSFDKVLTLSGDFVYISYEVERALLDLGKSENVVAGNPEDSRITLNITIKNATEQAVQKFIWDLNEHVSSGKFDFSLARAQAASHKIRAYEVESQLHIVRLLFMIISQGWDEKSKPLISCAYEQIPGFLANLHKLEAKVSVSDRRMLGEGLITFLTDTHYARLDHEDYGWGSWMSEDESVAAMRFWLEDETTIETLRPKERRWIKEMTDRSLGRLGFAKDMATAVASQWLTDIRTYSFRLYNWLDTFIDNNTPISPSPPPSEVDEEVVAEEALEHTEDLALPDSKEPAEVSIDADGPKPMENLEDSEKQDPNEADDTEKEEHTEETPELTTVERINRAATWARENASVTPSDTYYAALGDTFWCASENAAAVSSYEQVSADYADRHFAELGHAQCALELENLDSALELAHKAFDRFRALADQKSLSESELGYYLQNLKNCGEGFEKLERFSDALSFYEEALSQKPDDYLGYWRVIKLYCQTGDSQNKGRQLLLDWTQDKAKFGGKTPAVSLVETVSEPDLTQVLRDLIHRMADQDTLSLFGTMITEALQLASARHDVVAQHELRYLQSIMFVRQSDPLSMTRAVSLWKDMIEAGAVETGPYYWQLWSLVLDVARLWMQYEFDTIRKRLVEDESLNTDSKKSLVAGFKGVFDQAVNYSSPLRDSRGIKSLESFAIHLYGIVDMHEARQLCKDDMASALEILSDSDPDNDVIGLELLARVFCVLRDRVGVLTALSLCDRPIMRRKVQGEIIDRDSEIWTSEMYGGLYRACDGCGKSLYSSDAEGIWWCPFCPGDGDWCTECLTKGKSATQRSEGCIRKHAPLYIHVVHPKYTETDLEGTKVRVDWEYEDDGNGGYTRKGGSTIELVEWVEDLRKQWDLPKPDGDGSRAQQ